MYTTIIITNMIYNNNYITTYYIMIYNNNYGRVEERAPQKPS